MEVFSTRKTYIEREALLGEDGLFAQRGCTGECAHCGLWSKEGCKVITEAPPADVVAVKYGRWFDGRCTNCAWEAPDFVQYEGYELEDWEPTPYCPSCGTEMVGG